MVSGFSRDELLGLCLFDCRFRMEQHPVQGANRRRECAEAAPDVLKSVLDCLADFPRGEPTHASRTFDNWTQHSVPSLDVALSIKKIGRVEGPKLCSGFELGPGRTPPCRPEFAHGDLQWARSLALFYRWPNLAL